MNPNTKKDLKRRYFSEVKNARRINPLYQSFFTFFYTAHCALKHDDVLLNIYSKDDSSAQRERLFRKLFFNIQNYHKIDFRQDHFISDNHDVSRGHTINRHHIPYPDNFFNVVITTKIILEHVSDPAAAIGEFHRILKPDSELFLIVPLVRRQHKLPHDYFRFTESGIKYLLTRAGFINLRLTPTNGFLGTLGSYSYFFQRGLKIPRYLEKCLDVFVYWCIEPICYILDHLDNGYGRDMTQYFLVRAKTIPDNENS